ncbi:MAG TPA: indole-3-glycerol phosphate synthase TrpC [bacterium]|nr:indole-3-glycerol phosphate synthase TrpC [bacterium]
MLLDKIVDYKRQELEAVRRKVSLKDVRAMAEDAAPRRGFIDAVLKPGIRIIAEVKKASPSAGVIRADFDPIKIAVAYEENGAACLSILTDEHFFQGSLKSLADIRRCVKIPLLRKDFTLDAYHVHEARAHGADAILLIVRILEDAQIKDYAALAQDLGMAALVEVHDEKEMERAKRAGATLIGVNNRNLDTLKVDLQTTVRLAPLAPKGAVLVGESGISAPEHVRKLRGVGVNAFLIGEYFMKSSDPGAALGNLLKSSSTD